MHFLKKQKKIYWGLWSPFPQRLMNGYSDKMPDFSLC